MKLTKIYLITTLFALSVLAGCDNQDDAITYSMTDLSSQITSLSSTQIGAGQRLTVTGRGLDRVVRVMVGNAAVPVRLFAERSESSITFSIPSTTPLGTSPLLFVFSGAGRAFSEVEIVPLQVANAFTPYTASVGEVVTITGLLLNLVDEVRLGSVQATIQEKSAGVLRFTVPAGAATGPITLISEFGTTTTEGLAVPNLTICNGSSTSVDCASSPLLNGSFELGTGDDFTNWAKQNGGTFMVATTNPTEVFKGTRALKVTRDGTLQSGEWRIQLGADAVDTEPGASYTVSLWAKASAAGGSMRVSLNSSPNDRYSANQDVPTQWTRLSFVFSQANGNATPVASTRVILDLNGNNTVATTFFIDDVKITRNN